MDRHLVEQQRRCDAGWRAGLAAGREQRGNLDAHLELLDGSGLLRPASRVLEVGCGIGTVVAELHRRGVPAVGVDLSQEAVAYGLSKYGQIILEVQAAEALPFADSSFDLVLSFDLLEHVRGVDLHLAEVRRVLAVGGHYLLATPNRWFAVLSEILAHRSLAWRGSHPSLHSPGGLRRRLAVHGFRARFCPVNPVTDWAMARLRLPRPVRRLARRVDLGRLPPPLRPHLYMVAERCAC